MEMSAINVLARITIIKLRRIGNNLKISHQRRCEGRETAFPVRVYETSFMNGLIQCSFILNFQSALMHALCLEGITNVTDLHKFYVTRVLQYRDRMLALCQQRRADLLEKRSKYLQRPSVAKVPKPAITVDTISFDTEASTHVIQASN